MTSENASLFISAASGSYFALSKLEAEEARPEGCRTDQVHQ